MRDVQHMFTSSLMHTCPTSQSRSRLGPCCLSVQHQLTSSPLVSLHHGQVFESVAALLLGFISRPQELDLPLFGFDFVLVLLQFLLSSDVWVCNRLQRPEKK